MSEPVIKTDAEWREQLSPEQFHVLRQKGTERAFTGKYWNEKAQGTYNCAGCGESLFTSETKFDSGSGWPSFYRPLDPSKVEEIVDRTHGMTRTEVTCKKCGAHLGHVFDDVPAQPTGLRYCMNSVALKFVTEADFKAKIETEAEAAKKVDKSEKKDTTPPAEVPKGVK